LYINHPKGKVMSFIQRYSLSAVALFTVLLAGCHSSAMQRAVSPLIGTWQINGSMPQPDADLPRFTQLTFRRNGTLDASYVAAGGLLASVVKSNSQVRQEQDSYTLVGAHHVRIIEGSRALDYRYEVRDGKLFFTGPNADEATVFARVHPNEDDDDTSAPDAATPTPNDLSQ